ncbi:farnesyl pyrophosphate synthetase, putative [Eimeria necatrix]|uniref:Farnesyl pyrophosphate synthetase, putative n=1 Tax=Eimeria necatrix TaxID=51315 RepID=U6MSA9_9EIME|nr:farnesyl pyrophosphate synthetase, putative [Eimeria necatrix]CDJ65988.1 farnesyl pyrophosphate synthetase, putative [Eimeria necatrix]
MMLVRRLCPSCISSLSLLPYTWPRQPLTLTAKCGHVGQLPEKSDQRRLFAPARSATVGNYVPKALCAVKANILSPHACYVDNYSLTKPTGAVATAQSTAKTVADESATEQRLSHAGEVKGDSAASATADPADVCWQEGMPCVSSIYVDIKRDQQRFLRMLNPMKGALLERIMACAPEGEADALTEYFSRVIDYNCIGGKLLRGLLTVYASLAANREIRFVQFKDSAAAAAAPAFPQTGATRGTVARTVTISGGRNPGAPGSADSCAAGEAALDKAFGSELCILGWAVELLQAAFLVADDQMDGAFTRRGKVCWYRRPEVGPANAINDAVFLIYSVHQLLREFLGDHPAYGPCTELLQNVAFNTVLGQHLDTNGHVNMLLLQQHQRSCVSIDVVKGDCCRPNLFVGLRHSGVSDFSLLAKVEEICLCTGDYFQAQDDFLDCFGCPEALGKAGSDIREGKCSWPLVEALAAAKPREAADLLEAYGRPEGEEVVRELYKQLGVRERFKLYEDSSRRKILRLVDGLSHPGIQSYFAALLQLLHGRPQ